MIEVVLARTNSINKFERCIRPYPLIYEDCYIYLTMERNSRWIEKKDTFGKNGQFHISGYGLQNLPINHCIYCKNNIYSSFKGHLARPKHTKNVLKFIDALENILKLNIDVVKYIHSFL